MHYQIFGCIVEVENLKQFLQMIKAISQQFNVTIQFFDAAKIAGEEHVKAAVEKAIRAMERRRNISQDLGVEILLYAAGNRQIQRALEMGIKEGRNEAVTVIVGDEVEDVERAIATLKKIILEADVLKYTEGKKKAIINYFHITPLELEAVGEEKIPKLLLERVALLDISK
ncbi:MAG: KEOPS complex subunit Cgi121 [Halobacteria archaeon]